MKKSFRYMTLALAMGAGMSLPTLPASAQLGLDLGVGTDVDIGANVGVESRSHSHDPYVYHGYESGHWHTRGEVERHHTWNSHYHGYDCYEAFQYTYEDGERVRYESTFCHTDDGHPVERRDTRVVVRID